MPRRTSAQLNAALQDLWRQYQAKRCLRARDALVEHYGYLVSNTRQRILPSVPVRVLPEDLEQEGRIALLKAVEQFDPKRKVQFSSYAITAIRGAMLEFLRRDDWVPRSVRGKQKQLKEAEEALTLHKGGAEVTDADRAAHLALSLDAFYQLYFEATVLQIVGLDEPVRENEAGADTLLVLESVRNPQPGPEQVALLQGQRDLLLRCVGWLPLPERTVIILYYFEGMKLTDIAGRMGRSDSRIHQLHQSGLRRLNGLVARETGLIEDAQPASAAQPEAAVAGEARAR